jgi:MFS transporter, OFA family, oxalate/formate antiporter
MAGEKVSQTKAEPRFFYGYVVVIAAFFIMTISWATYNSFGVFFTPMSTAFDWDRGVTSGAFSVSMFIYGVLGIVVGAINDRFGPKVLLITCGILLGLGYLLMSQVSTIWQLYIALGLIIGIGMSGVWVPLLSTVARWSVRRQTLMSGIVVAGVSVGGLIGPPVISRLIESYHWQKTYIITGVAVTVLILIATIFIKRAPPRMEQVQRVKKKEINKEASVVFNSFSFKEAVRTRQFWLLSGLFFCFGFTLYGVVVHIVPHAIDLKIAAVAAASILAVRGGVSIFGNYILGSLADRIGNKQIFIFGFIIFTGAFLLLSFTDAKWVLYLFIVMLGFAGGGMAASESPTTAWLFGLGSHGLIYGVVHVGFTLGAAAGPFVMGEIFDRTESYHLAFLSCIAFSVIGIILTTMLKPAQKSAPSKSS